MKASLKLRDDGRNPLLRAKVPITAVGLPFVSAVTVGDSSDLSFSLRTCSAAGPSLHFSYKPTDHAETLSLAVKSGVGSLGSPVDSPLLLSARFSLLGGRHPSFSMQIRHRFGNFSLKRTALSSPLGSPDLGLDFGRFGSGGGVLSGVSVFANTELPMAKRAAVRFRWGVNFAPDLEKQLPFLTADKISIERVGDVDTGRETPAESAGDVETLKGVCVWMRREVDALRTENRLIGERIKDLKMGIPARDQRGFEVPGKKPPVGGDFSEFEKWRRKKNGVSTAGISSATDVEEELRKALKAATS